MNENNAEIYGIPDDITNLAGDVFGNVESAKIWFNENNICLDGKRPIDMIGSEEGKAAVIAILNRIEHGIFS